MQIYIYIHFILYIIYFIALFINSYKFLTSSPPENKYLLQLIILIALGFVYTMIEDIIIAT